jgi:hypothetical protein
MTIENTHNQSTHLLQKVPFMRTVSRHIARRKALAIAQERSNDFQALNKKGLPVSETQRSAVIALKAIEESSDWTQMRSFLKSEALGIRLFNNEPAAKKVDLIRELV